MNMHRLSITGILCGILLAAGGQSQVFAARQPEVLVTASPREVTIADPIIYTVRIVTPGDVEIKPPEEMTQMGSFAVRHMTKNMRPSRSGLVVQERVYELAGFEVGAQTIPAYTIGYRQSGATEWQDIETDTVSITVKSVLGQDANQRLRPLKPKLARWDRGVWDVLAMLALAGVGVGLWRWIRSRRLKAAAITPLVPAHIIAFRELDALRQARLVEQGKMTEFFERLSGCVRLYLENRFHLRAPQMSTEEFLETAKTSPLLQGEQKRLLRDFLSLADLVKFGRYGSSPHEAGQAFNAAHHFVEQTKREVLADAEKVA